MPQPTQISSKSTFLKAYSLQAIDTVLYYTADVISATNYYHFGSQMPGRNLEGERYRFGFNGQEKDNEISGTGNSYTAEYWQYDARLGRRWNVDPKGKPYESPFSVFSNNPMIMIDPEGDSTVFYRANGTILFAMSSQYNKPVICIIPDNKLKEFISAKNTILESDAYSKDNKLMENYLRSYGINYDLNDFYKFYENSINEKNEYDDDRYYRAYDGKPLYSEVSAILNMTTENGYKLIKIGEFITNYGDGNPVMCTKSNGFLDIHLHLAEGRDIWYLNELGTFEPLKNPPIGSTDILETGLSWDIDHTKTRNGSGLFEVNVGGRGDIRLYNGDSKIITTNRQNFQKDVQTYSQ